MFLASCPLMAGLHIQCSNILYTSIHKNNIENLASARLQSTTHSVYNHLKRNRMATYDKIGELLHFARTDLIIHTAHAFLRPI